MWARELGTVVLSKISPLFSSFIGAPFHAIHVAGGIVVLRRFPLCCMHSSWFRVLGTSNPAFVLFGRESGLFSLPKHHA